LMRIDFPILALCCLTPQSRRHSGRGSPFHSKPCVPALRQAQNRLRQAQPERSEVFMTKQKPLEMRLPWVSMSNAMFLVAGNACLLRVMACFMAQIQV